MFVISCCDRTTTTTTIQKLFAFSFRIKCLTEIFKKIIRNLSWYLTSCHLQNYKYKYLFKIVCTMSFSKTKFIGLDKFVKTNLISYFSFSSFFLFYCLCWAIYIKYQLYIRSVIRMSLISKYFSIEEKIYWVK